VLRPNPTTDWVISKTTAHIGLVSEDDYIAAQAVNAIATPEDGSTRVYALVGLLICRLCGRRLESHWVYHRPGYRCRHGHTSASPALPGRAKYLYLREDHILTRIIKQLPNQEPIHTNEAITEHRPTEIGDYLRANNITIICDATSCTLETSPPG
jgi:site-specific DNA recombinase